MWDRTCAFHAAPNLLTRVNSKNIDCKEKNLKASQNILRSVNITVSSTSLLMVALDTICLFFYEFCSIQFPNSVGLLNLFIVISTFSLKFASALGIAGQCLVNSMIDSYT